MSENLVGSLLWWQGSSEEDPNQSQAWMSCMCHCKGNCILSNIQGYWWKALLSWVWSSTTMNKLPLSWHIVLVLHVYVTAVMFYLRNLCHFLCYYITTNTITVPLPILFSIVFLLQLHFLFHFINIVLLPLPCIYFSSTCPILFKFSFTSCNFGLANNVICSL